MQEGISDLSMSLAFVEVNLFTMSEMVKSGLLPFMHATTPATSEEAVDVPLFNVKPVSYYK